MEQGVFNEHLYAIGVTDSSLMECKKVAEPDTVNHQDRPTVGGLPGPVDRDPELSPFTHIQPINPI